MALIRRYPNSLFDYMQREFDKLQNRALAESDDSGNVVTSDWAPAVDIKEEDAQYKIIADIPGVDPKDIDIHMEDGVLTIKGERDTEKKDEKENYKRIERVHGVFYRRFTMPDNADAEKISAKSNHGVLEVTIPKKEAAQPRKISVNQ